MKNKFLFLTKISLQRKIKTKWFVIANILLALAIILVANIDLIINHFGGDFNDTSKIYVIDNTNTSYELFDTYMKTNIDQYSTGDFEISLIDNTKDEMVEKLKNDENEKDSIVLIINNSEENIIDVEMISNDFIDTMSTTIINSSINGVKTYLAATKYNLNAEQLTNLTSGVLIDRTVLNEELDSTEENMTMIMTTVFPVVILPFFMLVIFLVQMIGAEVNDEKTTKGMEIIISNVSPKVHFFSKCLAGNVFILFQLFLLISYLLIALFIRSNLGSDSSITGELTSLLSGIFTTDFISSLKHMIPVMLLLMILSFIAYSLLAGILASMTTNTEDFQQMQTPIMLVNLLGYYLAIMAGTFKGSIIIKIIGYIPFISAILSPSLYVIGEFTIIDLLIAILLTILVIFLLIRYGLRIYKVGILNYSSGNLWKKMFTALKNK